PQFIAAADVLDKQAGHGMLDARMDRCDLPATQADQAAACTAQLAVGTGTGELFNRLAVAVGDFDLEHGVALVNQLDGAEIFLVALEHPFFAGNLQGIGRVRRIDQQARRDEDHQLGAVTLEALVAEQRADERHVLQPDDAFGGNLAVFGDQPGQHQGFTDLELHIVLGAAGFERGVLANLIGLVRLADLGLDLGRHLILAVELGLDVEQDAEVLVLDRGAADAAGDHGYFATNSQLRLAA